MNGPRLQRFATQLAWPTVTLGLPLLMAFCLAAMGRVWWCDAGDWRPWAWDVWSKHNSQHLVDPYTLSHIQHGLGFYLILLWTLGQRLPTAALVLIVAMVEAGWEIVENTDMMIQRYREVTISLDYYGDSILNSMGDYAACLGGVLLARRLPQMVSVSLFVVLEVASIIWIRDSLVLNILMLIWPIEAIREWQLSGAN